MRIRPLMLVLALAASFPALAQQMVYYHYLSGTGFVINNDGNIITNAHVVKDCQSISILTPKGEQQAILVAADTKLDLAVLKTPYISPSIAPLRWNISDLKVGDDVALMGFPGKEGANGHYQFKKTKIISLKGPGGQDRWIQLSSVAAQGNSGGPVLDMNGNVIAVIAGMTLSYKADDNGNPEGAPVSQSDVAIPLAALQGFLQEHAIGFYESKSDGRVYGDGDLRDTAHNFIVPVRCIQDVETH